MILLHLSVLDFAWYYFMLFLNIILFLSDILKDTIQFFHYSILTYYPIRVMQCFDVLFYHLHVIFW